MVSPHIQSIGTAIAYNISILISLLFQIYSSRSFISLREFLFNLLKYTLFSLCMGLFVTTIGELLIQFNKVVIIDFQCILAIFIYIISLIVSKDRILYRVINQIVRK